MISRWIKLPFLSIILIFTIFLLGCDNITKNQDEAELYMMVSEVNKEVPIKVAPGQTINYLEYDSKSKKLNITFGFTDGWEYGREYSYDNYFKLTYSKAEKVFKKRIIKDLLSKRSHELLGLLLKNNVALVYKMYYYKTRKQINIEFSPDELREIYRKYYPEQYSKEFESNV